jgi:hypothetical protein
MPPLWTRVRAGDRGEGPQDRRGRAGTVTSLGFTKVAAWRTQGPATSTPRFRPWRDGCPVRWPRWPGSPTTIAGPGCPMGLPRSPPWTPDRRARLGANPVRLLTDAPTAVLDWAAADPDLVARGARLSAAIDDDAGRAPRAGPVTAENPVAFLCAEFGSTRRSPSTRAGWVCSPVTSSRRPRTWHCRWWVSGCCTAPATSTSASTRPVCNTSTGSTPTPRCCRAYGSRTAAASP